MSLSKDSVTDVILIVAALTVVALLVRREFFNKPAHSSIIEAPEYIPDWQKIAQSGIATGPETALVKIIEFADLECPACARLQPTLDSLERVHPDRLSVIFVHYPLAQHRFAPGAARSLECADEQAVAKQMMTAFYSGQDSLGLKSWSSYALDAHVPSIDDFDQCFNSGRKFNRISEGLEWGQKIGVKGTPTIIVNGWRAHGAAALKQAVDSILRGREPFAKSE